MRTLKHLYEWLKLNWALAISVALVLCFFAPIILTGQVLSQSHILYNAFPWQSINADKSRIEYRHFGDVVDSYYPAIIFLLHWLKRGILPLWDPTVAGGQPFVLATYFFLYPPNLLYLLIPIQMAFTWHVMVRFLVASVFTYLLARELKLSEASSVLAALAFTFNGFHIVWLGWPHTSETILLPVLLWSIFKAMHTGQDRYFVILAFTTLFLLAGGFLPVAGYVLYAVGGFVLFAFWGHYREVSLPRSVSLARTILIGLAVAAGILLSAVYILPFVRNLLQSGYAVERAQDSALYRNFYLPFWQIILYLIPGYYGGIDTPYWGSVNLVEASGYVGVWSLILALISLGRLRSHIFRTPGYLYSLCLTIVSLSVVYGLRPLAALVAALPGFQFSINTRLLGLAAFGLAFLAAYGLEFLKGLEKAKVLMWVTGAIILVVGLALAIEAYWILSTNSPYTFNEGLFGAFGRPSWDKLTFYAALRQEKWATLLNAARFGGQLGVGIALFVVYRRMNLRPIILQLLLVALVAFDLLGFARWYQPVSPQTNPYPDFPSLQVLRSSSEPSRFLAIAGRVLPGNTASAYQLQNAAGHSISHPTRYTRYLSILDQNVWNRRAHGTHLLIGQHISDFESRLVDLLSIRYILEAPASIEDLEYRTVASQEAGGTPVGEIYGDVQQGQTFVAGANNLQEVDLLLATYARTNHGEVIFHLKTDPAASEDLVRIPIPAERIFDNQWAVFGFNPIPDSAGHHFYFYLESPSSQPGDAITIWSTQGDTYSEGQRYVNGMPAQGDLTFRAVAKTYVPTKFKTIHSAPDMLIFENTVALPRAYAVPHSIVLDNEQDILTRLQSPDFDPRQTVILEESGPIKEAADGFAFDSSRVKITRYEPNQVVIEAALPEPGWVVLTDLNYPGWTAEVDGQRVRLYQANYLFRAVPLSAGQHIIIFRFRPSSVTWGFAISLTTLLALTLVVGLRRWRLWARKLRNRYASPRIREVFREKYRPK
jgi:hypothetical protein